MKIYERLVIDIETGQSLEEISYEYNGPLALCDTNVEATPKSATEEAIDQTQLQLLQKQVSMTEELEPFILESAGYTRNADGQIVKSDTKTAEDILTEKSLALQGYSTTGESLTEEQMLSYMTETEKLSYLNQKANLERQQKALAGELEISPVLEKELAGEETQLKEVLARKLGADWETSTSGQNLLTELQAKADLVREEARQGIITSSEGVAASMANQSTMEEKNREMLASLSSDNTTTKINKLMSLMGVNTTAMNSLSDVSSIYASDRANRQNVNLSNAANKTSTTNSAIGGAGAAAAAAAAAA